MKFLSHFKSLSLAVIAISTAAVSSSNAAVISFNSIGGTGNPMGASETAGAPGANANNWNEMRSLSGSRVAGTVTDSSGSTLATTSVTWSGGGVANANGGTTTNDRKMWESEWDLFSGNTTTIDMTISVTNVPYTNYDVYFYVQDANNAATRGGDVVANGVTKSITMLNSPDSNYTNYIEADSAFTWNSGTTDVGNFLKIEGLSGDLTLTMSSKNTTTPRLRMSGFQIVEVVPEPSSAAILGVSGVFLLLRRRRK